jgi:hypothetical protein
MMSDQTLATKSFIISNQSGDDRYIFDMATRQVCIEFDIDEDGHINGVEGAERSECSVRVKLLSKEKDFGMNGAEYYYYFQASVVKQDD